MSEIYSRELSEMFDEICGGYCIPDWSLYILPAETIKKDYGYAVSPMGICCYDEKCVIVNLEHKNSSSRDDVIDTLLHECAHMLAHEIDGAVGHGKVWKEWARRLGAVPKAKSKAVSTELHLSELKTRKYAVVFVNGDVVELVCTAGKRWKNLHLRKAVRFPDSFGKLYMVPSEIFLRGDIDEMKRNLIR